MSTLYYKLQPISGAAKKEQEAVRYRAVLESKGSLGTDEIAQAVEKSCSATHSDVLGVLNALADVAGQALSTGKSVHLDGLGVFSLSLTSSTITDYNTPVTRNLSVKRVAFRADRSLIKQVRESVFRRSRSARTVCPDYSDEEILALLREQLAADPTEPFTAADFVRFTQYNRNKACSTLKRLTAEGKLKRVGKPRNPVYLLLSTSEV